MHRSCMFHGSPIPERRPTPPVALLVSRRSSQSLTITTGLFVVFETKRQVLTSLVCKSRCRIRDELSYCSCNADADQGSSYTGKLTTVVGLSNMMHI
jgi:hypothetical protein